MEQILLYSHVFCGGTVLLLGLVQMLNRKGSKNHIQLGQVYVGAMWWICLSAFSIIAFYRFSAFLMVIGVLTFYSSFSGVRVLRRKKIGREMWYDWMVAVITVLFGAGLVGYGVYSYMNGKQILALLSVIFGFFTASNAIQDIRFFLKPDLKVGNWWIRQHIGAMGGSYIAALTAFAVQNPNLFISNSSYQWLLWILPAVIGSPIIAIFTKKWARKTT